MIIKNSRNYLILILLIIFCVAFCSPLFICRSAWSGEFVFNEQYAIDNYFKNRPLDSIEGIWEWDTQYGHYIVAITNVDSLEKKDKIKNEYGKNIQYIGLLTENIGPLKKGYAKIVLNKPFGGFYKGYFIGYESYGNYVYDADELPLKTSVGNDSLDMEIRTLTGDTVEINASRKYPILKTSVIKKGVGFYLTDDIVATTYSNVAETKSVAISSRGAYFTGKVIVKDEMNDLALVLLENKNSSVRKYIRLGDVNKMNEGDSVYIYNTSVFEGEIKNERVAGKIIKMVGERGDPRVYEIDIKISKTSNGTPLFNAKDEIIGIALSPGYDKYFKSTAMIPEGVAYVVKINNLYNLMSTARECQRKETTPIDPSNVASNPFDYMVTIE